MNPIVKNILAVILGWFIGGIVNFAIASYLGPLFIPLAPNIDGASSEVLNANIQLFEAKHFIFPFLGHAIGTLVGAFIAFKGGATHKPKLAMFVGFFFFLGGIAVTFLIPFPKWMIVVDLLFAYFPMAWLAIKLAGESDQNFTNS